MRKRKLYITSSCHCANNKIISHVVTECPNKFKGALNDIHTRNGDNMVYKTR